MRRRTKHGDAHPVRDRRVALEIESAYGIPEPAPVAMAEPVLSPAPARPKLQIPLDAPHPAWSGAKSARGWFLGAIVFSLLLHLSAVTLFEVVVYFPRYDMKFFDVQIVRAPESETGKEFHTAAAGAPDKLQLLALDDLLGLGGAEESLPKIQLSEVEFGLQDRIRALNTDSRVTLKTPPYDDGPTDSWAQFSSALRNAGRTVTGLGAPLGGLAPEKAPRPAIEAPAAPGFTARIEWNSAPKDRRLLLRPPIEALRANIPAGVHWPLEFVLKVAPSGRVLNIFGDPLLDAGEFADKVQMGLLNYRFDPIEQDTNQLATCYIAPAEKSP